jgi:hypothetical protein
LPRDRCLPVSHRHYVGMPEGELNPSERAKIRAANINPTGRLFQATSATFRNAFTSGRSSFPPILHRIW